MRLLVLLPALLGLAASAVAQPALDGALGASTHADAARAFYAARGGQPLWTTSGGELSDRGRALVGALGRVGEDGLDPAAYLGRLPTAVAAREAALTTAFLAFCEHLMRGRVDPALVHRDWRAERRRLDAGAALDVAARRGAAVAFESARPPHPGYHALRRALGRLRAESGASWPPLPDGPPLREGDQGPGGAALRQRLAATGDLGGPGTDDRFDGGLRQAVERAQARLGLAVDGVVGPGTRAALDVTPAERARQVALNLERWRWLPADLGDRHVLIDAAGMTTALVEDGQAVWTGRTIVGTLQTPTPGFSSEITHAVLSPYWNVPASIARAEIWPRVRRDPGYLARHDMERRPGGTLRQRPGPANPLGPVKFIFETPFGVRLHGTSAPALFERHSRTFSHGCVRVERPLDLADRLLRDWDAARIQATVAAGDEVWVALPSPVAIHAVYWTARADAAGSLRLSPDVYGRDRALAQALARALGQREPGRA